MGIVVSSGAMSAAAGATSRKCEYFIDCYGQSKNVDCGMFLLTVQEGVRKGIPR